MTIFKLLLATGISALALGSAAHASDLILDDAPMMASNAGGNFDGGFVGVFGGGALGDLEFPEFGSSIPFSIDPEGYLLGVDAGFNFSLGNGMVLGIVGDIAHADLTDGFGGEGTSISSTIDWVGSVRARAGFDAGNFMPYLTGGLAAAHNTLDFSNPSGDPEETSFSDDQTHVGWTLGAGVEFAATEQLSVDVAYRYNDYGTASYTVPFAGDAEEAGEADFGLTSHQLTVGLHYGF